MNNIYKLLKEKYDISREVVDFVNKCEVEILDKFAKYDKVKEYNQYKILNIMQENNLTYSDFNWTTGYGYGDIGRDKVEKIYADLFKSEDALVRPNIVSGTHAISLCLFSLLKHGDHLLSASGTPYDTLLKVIGTEGKEEGSLIEHGIYYDEVELLDNKINVEEVIKSIKVNTKMIILQRSTGYSDRKALTIKDLKDAINKIKEYNDKIIIFVDNCYGEFTETIEPIEIGADVIAGSLIKNPGGGLAYSGGYIVGKENYIRRIANRLTAPGIGKECGLTFGMSRQILQGLFLAPNVVSESLKGATLISKAFETLSYKCVPSLDDHRSDIIQAIELGSAEKVVEFCKAIQETSPVDSFVTPIPWNMPGYENEVVMAAGGFIEGSSIELSADGPIREPYYVYFQGGLSYHHCKLALMKILSYFIFKNFLSVNQIQ